MSIFRPVFRPAIRRQVLRSPFSLRAPSAAVTISAPVPVGAGAFTAVAAAPYTPPLPAGWLVDDLLLLVTSTSNNGGISTSSPTYSGWKAIPKSFQAQGIENMMGATRMQAYWRFATAGQVAPEMNNTGDHQTAAIFAVRGVDKTHPFDVAAGTSTMYSTAQALPGVTTRVPQTLLVMLLSHAITAAGAQASGHTNANLASLTERVDDSTTLGVGGGLVILTGVKATAGATGDTASTLALPSYASIITLALRPIGSPPITGTPIASNTQLAEGAALVLPTTSTIRYGSAPPASGNFVQDIFPPGDYGFVGNQLFINGDPWPFNPKVVTVNPT